MFSGQCGLMVSVTLSMGPAHSQRLSWRGLHQLLSPWEKWNLFAGGMPQCHHPTLLLDDPPPLLCPRPSPLAEGTSHRPHPVPFLLGSFFLPPFNTQPSLKLPGLFSSRPPHSSDLQVLTSVEGGVPPFSFQQIMAPTPGCVA